MSNLLPPLSKQTLSQSLCDNCWATDGVLTQITVPEINEGYLSYCKHCVNKTKEQFQQINININV